MKFEEITEDTVVYPGEYLLHLPSKQIVLCSAYRKNLGKIKALKQGRLMEDDVRAFKKISMSAAERKRQRRKSCGGCKGGR